MVDFYGALSISDKGPIGAHKLNKDEQCANDNESISFESRELK